MDKVMIYDVFEFLGFHLCKRLLEKGYSVNGIHFNTESDDLFLDEKRSEVGRNANFAEKNQQDLEKLIEKEENEPAIIILSFYEWFMTCKQSPLPNTKIPQMVQLLTKQEKTKNQIVCLLPIQLLANTEELAATEELREFIQQIDQKDEWIQLFYLPTIFGPWQPPSFLFQKALLNQLNRVTDEMEEKEWPGDAIYIDDALDLIIERIETGKKGSYLLESGIPNSWEQCADFLNVDPSLRSKLANIGIKNDDQIVKLTLKQVTPYQNSLRIQKKHLSRVCGLKDES